MEHDEIMLLVKRAITRLIICDKHLLKHNLNEPSITNKLAEHLQLFFPEYNVDCEYNGNVESQNGRKTVYIPEINEIASTLKSKAENLLKKNDGKLNEDYSKSKLVYPDIIIHERGSNKNNICIIEAKKDSRGEDAIDFDRTKLLAYTNPKQFHYIAGVLVILNVRNRRITSITLEECRNGVHYSIYPRIEINHSI